MLVLALGIRMYEVVVKFCCLMNFWENGSQMENVDFGEFVW